MTGYLLLNSGEGGPAQCAQHVELGSEPDDPAIADIMGIICG